MKTFSAAILMQELGASHDTRSWTSILFSVLSKMNNSIYNTWIRKKCLNLFKLPLIG